MVVCQIQNFPGEFQPAWGGILTEERHPQSFIGIYGGDLKIFEVSCSYKSKTGPKTPAALNRPYKPVPPV